MNSFDCPTDFRVQGWGVSLIAHAAFVSVAVMVVAQVKFVPDQDVFRWEIAIVRPPTSEPTTATTDPPPASSVSQPTSATTPPPVETQKPSVPRRVESRQVVESIQAEPKTLLARPIEQQVLERRPVEQVQPIKQVEASPETVTSHHIEKPETYENKQVVQERPQVEDKAAPVATQAPHELATVHKQEMISTAQPKETPLTTTEVGSMESPQPVTKTIVPVEQTASAMTEPAPVKQQTAVESPPPVTRDVAQNSKESPPVEPHPVVARTDPGPAAETIAPSPSPSAERVPEQAPLNHTDPAQARQSPSPSDMVAKAYPAPRADFGWLTQTLWRKIEELKRYPHTARMNRWEGTVVVRAVIRQDGYFSELTMEKSSGHDVLDQDAIELLRRASPLTLKHELGRPELTIRVPISYKLE